MGPAKFRNLVDHSCGSEVGTGARIPVAASGLPSLGRGFRSFAENRDATRRTWPKPGSCAGDRDRRVAGDLAERDRKLSYSRILRAGLWGGGQTAPWQACRSPYRFLAIGLETGPLAKVVSEATEQPPCGRIFPAIQMAICLNFWGTIARALVLSRRGLSPCEAMRYGSGRSGRILKTQAGRAPWSNLGRRTEIHALCWGRVGRMCPEGSLFRSTFTNGCVLRPAGPCGVPGGRRRPGGESIWLELLQQGMAQRKHEWQ